MLESDLRESINIDIDLKLENFGTNMFEAMNENLASFKQEFLEFAKSFFPAPAKVQERPSLSER